ncbi:GNAT family N-acetyltransferase [Dictyobacter formicarum]|uniref:N-acetyltransferase n=1 Tax=Dictyobacter formicarum TaxID=2778368 RepID=A0ABQ3VRM3_9CHLR|nr:GNAT family N-acetyltransferase [Dictyobacter formicarum]GHO88470.1 N-acetyltransferase [Dictyobacter formicarum]
MSNEPEVINNTAEHRYEIHLNDQVAILTYQREGQHIVYQHTGVPPALEHHGLGSILAHAALEDARAAHLSVVPSCPFVAKYIQHHPEYQSLVDNLNK